MTNEQLVSRIEAMVAMLVERNRTPTVNDKAYADALAEDRDFRIEGRDIEAMRFRTWQEAIEKNTRAMDRIADAIELASKVRA